MEKEKLQKFKLKPNTYRVSSVTFIEIILFWTIAMEFLITELELPSYLRFFNDAIVLLLIARIVTKLSRLNAPQYKWILLDFFAFLVVVVVGVIGNLVPFRLVLWGGRNTFRFFVYFFCCVVYLKRKHIERIMNMLLVVQVLNLILCLYQYFVLDRWSDTLGGIFGQGNTTGTCGLCLLLVSYYFTMFLNNKTGLIRFIFSIVSSMIISAIAEQKALFIILGVALVMGVLLTGLSIRKVLAVIVCSIAFIIGLRILDNIASESFNVLSSFDDILEYSQTTYDEGYRLPRIGSFEIIDEKFFNENWFNRAVGFGLGSCDFSSVQFFKSDFYIQYGFLNYRWFTHQWMFLENGYFGIITIVGFWIINAVSMLFYRRKSKPENRTIIDTSIICSITTIMLMWLGPTLKVDSGYIVYFSVAMGVAVLKDTVDEKGYTKANTNVKEMEDELLTVDKHELETPDISYKAEIIRNREEHINPVFNNSEKAESLSMPDIHLNKGHWIEETKD